MTDDQADRSRRLLGSPLGRTATAVAAAAAFLFGVQLLSAATTAASPRLEPTLAAVVAGRGPALGAGWLGAYGMLNGSVVAAVALALFESDLVTTSQLFLLIAGSRLGAAAVVVIVGGLDYLQRGATTLREATSLGLLTFVVTHSIYLPATVLGTALLEAPHTGLDTGLGLSTGRLDWFGAFAPYTAVVVESVGAGVAFVLSVGVLLGSLRAVDAVVRSLDAERVGRAAGRLLARRPLAFVGGLVVTAATTSVAFSLGVAVPLYNLGVVERRQFVPYVLGASVGTLGDTAVVALALGTETGLFVTGLLAASATAATALAFALYDSYLAIVEGVHDWLLADPRNVAVVLAVLLGAPLLLLVVPW